MGFYDFIDAITASLPFGEPVDAESASESKDQEQESKPEQKLKEGESEDSEDKEDGAEGADEDGGDEEDGGADEEEEEEEEEPEDPKAKLEEDCRNSSECKKYKSHYDACAARVDEGSKEDCVEEFFELAHCATACAAPKLWKLLK